MFEEVKATFYMSLAKSIKKRKEILKLKRDDILPDPTRVSRIVKHIRNEHYPYLIGKGEYPYLNYLFLCKDHDSFIKEDVLNIEAEQHIKKFGNNYDEMFWGHIDWDKMFQDVIAELLKLDISEGFGKMFEDTLVDYVPYAVIRYDELPFEYARIYIFPDERDIKRRDAVKWVHLRHGSELFKQIFYEKFGGKNLCDFDKKFSEFISDYLEKKKPNDYSLGLQAYNVFKNVSGYSAQWQHFAEVQYSDISDEKSDLAKLLREYMDNGQEQIKKLEKFQQDFDAFQINIK